MSKIHEYLQEEFDCLVKKEDSKENKAYLFGYVSGSYPYYIHLRNEYGVEHAKEVFKKFFKGEELIDEYFRKLVELEEETNSEKSN